MRLTALTISLFICSGIFAQKIDGKLSVAVKALEADPQFKHAILSMYVVDSKTGAVVFDKNSQLGLAPASCQKVITSTSAFEFLKGNYSYNTEIGLYSQNNKNYLYIKSSGDPTLGSWRWDNTKMDTILKRILNACRKYNISTFDDAILDESDFETQATPNGWTWDDIGNYYGAGARALNWHENQYDIILKPGKKEGDSVKVINTDPPLLVSGIVNELSTGKPGSGDQSVIYLPEGGSLAYLRGTIASGQDGFTISGSMPDAGRSFLTMIKESLEKNEIKIDGKMQINHDKGEVPSDMLALLWIKSPPFDSINYWFLKRSVNLYGEALVKTISLQKTDKGSTEAGLNIIKDFWESKNIERSSLHIIDGSGLSPANRVTTNALVTVMQYAKQQPWFSSFYNALPELNGIKMKDGYINGVRSFTGYVKSKDGNEYTFSFIVNNFDGNAGMVREKMWKVLDILK